MSIPAGYQLHVTTWENDADDYRTKILSGLTKEDVNFLLCIAKQFRSKNGPVKGIGNAAVKYDQMVDVIANARKQHPNISDKWKEEFNPDSMIVAGDQELHEEHLYEALTENLLHYPVSEYYQELENFCRVFSGFKVYEVPAEAIEVSEQFG